MSINFNRIKIPAVVKV